MSEKIVSSAVRAFIYRDENMTRIATVTRSSKILPIALVTFINVDGGEYKEHTVIPFLSEVNGMRKAKHFILTGEVQGEKDD